MPLQFYFAKLFVTVQKELLVATDARLNLATEVLAAIRLVKFNAWEGRFFDKMQKTRKTELKLLARRFVVWTLQVSSGVKSQESGTRADFPSAVPRRAYSLGEPPLWSPS